MRILYIVPYTPTPIRTRPYNLIRALARRGHRVTVAALWEDAAERAALADLQSQGIEIIARPLPRWRSLWNCLRALPTPTPLQAVYCWQPALARNLQSAICHLPSAICHPQSAISNLHPDVIHVEHLRGARYGLYLQSAIRNLQSAIVWDSVDCISYLFEQAARDSRTLQGRLMTRLELGRTRRYEGWLARRFDRVLVTSAVDRAALEGLAALHSSPSPLRRGGKGGEVVVLPNGVDLAYFTPDETPRAAATVLFSGKMSYHANVTAALHLAHDIMPLVWARRPDVQVWIVGKDPPQNVQRLNVQRSTFQRSNVQRSTSQRSNVPCITVTGAVPDLRPYLRQATIAAAPVPYGAGIQNKVLEAMACATPVVASRQAVAALQAIPGEHLLVADDAQDFARCLLCLLDDPELARRLGAAGRRYVEQHHDWDAIAAQLEEIYREAIADHADRNR